MANVRLAADVVRALSNYLVDRARRGPAAFDAQLEGLLGQVETRLSDGYGMETVERFKDQPKGQVEKNALQLQLGRAIESDAHFSRQLSSALTGQPASHRRRRLRVGGVAVLAVILLGASFALGRVTSWRSSNQATSETVTQTVTATPSPPTTTDAPTTTTTAEPSVEPSVPPSGEPGDGGSYPPGTPVYLTSLPRPNDEWTYEHGDHNVGFKQYNDSMWRPLNTCSTVRSVDQQFRLTDFSRLEVKAIGTDDEADASLRVTYEVFADTNTVDPIASVELAPGQGKPLEVNLPQGIFALTLRLSVNSTDSPECHRGNAVWGSPYVVAAGQ